MRKLTIDLTDLNFSLFKSDEYLIVRTINFYRLSTEEKLKEIKCLDEIVGLKDRPVVISENDDGIVAVVKLLRSLGADVKSTASCIYYESSNNGHCVPKWAVKELLPISLELEDKLSENE